MDNLPSKTILCVALLLAGCTPPDSERSAICPLYEEANQLYESRPMREYERRLLAHRKDYVERYCK